MRAALILAATSLLGACAKPARWPAARLDHHRAELRTIEVGGRQRTFVYAPGPSSRSPKPLMLIYHGSGGTAQSFLDQTAMGLAGVEAGMVVAALDAAPGTDGRWSVAPVDIGFIDDVAFTRAVLASIMADVRIDTLRILAVGYSRGAQFTYQLACRAPEIVRAIVPVSGGMPPAHRAWCDSTAALPHPAVLMGYGTIDPVSVNVPKDAAYWAERNQCAPKPVETAVPGRRSVWNITRSEYGPCARGDVVAYKVEPLEHLWPGQAFDFERAITTWFLGLPKR